MARHMNPTIDITEYQNPDKENWAKGEWTSEPDIETFQHSGFLCVVVRPTGFGQLNGYVAVPKESSWHGKPKHCVRIDLDGHSPDYTSKGQPCENLLHLKGYWWIGFDCARGDDLVPSLANYYKREGIGKDKVYRNFEYVKSLTTQLAEYLSTPFTSRKRRKFPIEELCIYSCFDMQFRTRIIALCSSIATERGLKGSFLRVKNGKFEVRSFSSEEFVRAESNLNDGIFLDSSGIFVRVGSDTFEIRDKDDEEWIQLKPSPDYGRILNNKEFLEVRMDS